MPQRHTQSCAVAPVWPLEGQTLHALGQSHQLRLQWPTTEGQSSATEGVAWIHCGWQHPAVIVTRHGETGATNRQ